MKINLIEGDISEGVLLLFSFSSFFFFLLAEIPRTTNVYRILYRACKIIIVELIKG